MKNLLLLALLFPALFSAFSQPVLLEKVEPKPGSLNIPYEKYKLPNGLKVIVHEDHSDPVAHVLVAYHVGSGREEPGKSGFAHFFEHMMFQGSEHVGDEEHFRIISSGGGWNNGFTQSDMTVYLQTVPANQMETALWLEADRMGFLLDAVTQEKFEIQRKTVKNEKYQNQVNQPYGMTDEILGQILYPSNHPYSWPVIGYTDDLDRANLNDLKNFFLRWYGPNNATLVVAGDVTTAEVLKLAEKYYGPINPGPPVTPMRYPAPILPVDRYGNYDDNIYLPLTEMVFPTVPNYHRDEPALDMLADLMGGGNNSIFYKQFVKSEKAIAAQVSHPCAELAGEFHISVLAYPDLGFNEVEKMIRQTILDFETSGVTEEDLSRVKEVMITNIMRSLESVDAKANRLMSWDILLGRPFNIEDDIDRYKKVTLEDVTRVYNKYIKGKNAAIVNVHPRLPDSKDSTVSVNPNANIPVTRGPDLMSEGVGDWKYVKAKDSFDRSKKPVPGPSRTPVVPEFYNTKLKNGIEVIGTRTSEVPKVVIIFEIDGGNLVLADDTRKVGLPQLTARLLGEGTKNYTTEEISAKLDRLGSTISFGGSRDENSVFIECFTDKLDETLKILEEKLMNPGFREDDFRRVHKQYVESLNNRRTSAGAMAQEAFNNLVYEGTSIGITPTAKTVKKLTLDDVKWYYSNYYSPSAADIIVVGDVDKDVIMSKLAFLDNWKGNEVKLPEITQFKPVEKTSIYVVHKAMAPQSVIIAGHLSQKFDATGEFYKSRIMNFALGGSFNSRLNLNLREAKGFTYGIRSGFGGSKYVGPFSVSTSVKRAATDSAVVEIMKELNGYVKGGITTEELEFTQSSMLNSEVLDYETTFDKAGFLSGIIEYGLPKDYTQQQAGILKTITRDELNALARKYIHPDKMHIVVVGNKYAIKDKLEALGYGKVTELTIE